MPLGGRSGAAALDLHYGVASYPNDGKSTDFLLKVADLRLYQCRSQSTFAGSGAAAPPPVRARRDEPAHGVERPPAKQPCRDRVRRRRQLRRPRVPREEERKVADAVEGGNLPEARSRTSPGPLRALNSRPCPEGESASAAPMSDRRRAFFGPPRRRRPVSSPSSPCSRSCSRLGDARPLALAIGGALGSPVPPDARGHPGGARRLRGAPGDGRGPRPPLLRDVADGRRPLAVRAASARGRRTVLALRGQGRRALLRGRVPDGRRRPRDPRRRSRPDRPPRSSRSPAWPSPLRPSS